MFRRKEVARAAASRQAEERNKAMVDPSENEAKIQADRSKAIFEQDCQEFRSLNGFLWQIPLIVSTLTGGLWFGVTKVDDGFVKASLFLLAAAINLAFILVLWRLRAGVMENILRQMRVYQGRSQGAGKYWTVAVFSALLALSAFVSLMAFRSNAPAFWSAVWPIVGPAP